MLRNKEPELAEKIDSSFGCFDLGFYRVNFVFGSRHLIIVRFWLQAPYYCLCCATLPLRQGTTDHRDSPMRQKHPANDFRSGLAIRIEHGAR